MIGAQLSYTCLILGIIIGLSLGAISTWYSIKKAKTPEERSHTLQTSTAIWLAMVAFLLMPLILEQRGIITYTWRIVGLMIYFVGLIPAIFYVKRKLAILRAES